MIQMTLLFFVYEALLVMYTLKSDSQEVYEKNSRLGKALFVVSVICLLIRVSSDIAQLYL